MSLNMGIAVPYHCIHFSSGWFSELYSIMGKWKCTIVVIYNNYGTFPFSHTHGFQACLRIELQLPRLILPSCILFRANIRSKVQLVDITLTS